MATPDFTGADILMAHEGSADASVSEAWRTEIRQRRQALAAEAVKAAPWLEAKARLGAL